MFILRSISDSSGSGAAHPTLIPHHGRRPQQQTNSSQQPIPRYILPANFSIPLRSELVHHCACAITKFFWVPSCRSREFHTPLDPTTQAILDAAGVHCFRLPIPASLLFLAYLHMVSLLAESSSTSLSSRHQCNLLRLYCLFPSLY